MISSISSVGRQRAIAALVVLGYFAAQPASAATVTFTDGTFVDGDWAASKIVDTTAGATASFVAGQVTVGGNPGAYRQVQHTYDAGIIAVGHVKSAAVYDPSVTGAIQFIDYGFDLIHLNPPPSQAVAYGLVLLQAGAYYRTGLDNIFTDTWTSFGHTGLTSANFVLVAGSGPTNPDFSATGAPIAFGYASYNNNTGGAPDLVRLSGIDNWQVAVTTVPLPPAAWLLGTGVAVVAARARLRRRAGTA